MNLIMDIAEKHGLWVIEDSAQAHFSEYQGKRAGLFGIAGSFSFYPGKNLGAYGDAGAIITNDKELAENCRKYARHGMLKKHEHEFEGINSRMDGIQAAILTTKLKYIHEWIQKRKEIAGLYKRLLEDVPEITLPEERPQTLHSYHLFVIQTEHRDELKAYLSEQGVKTAIHYPKALPNLQAYEYLGYQRSDFPVASELEGQMLSLPIYPEITEEQVKFVVDSIKDFISNN